jgi:hypothetical protein
MRPWVQSPAHKKLSVLQKIFPDPSMMMQDTDILKLEVTKIKIVKSGSNNVRFEGSPK